MGKWELWCLRAKDGYLKGQVNLQVGVEGVQKRMMAKWGKERFLSTGPMWFGKIFHVHEVTMSLFPLGFFLFYSKNYLVWASRFLNPCICMVSDNIYLSTVQVVTLYGISLVWVLQSPLGSSLTCSVKYLIGEEPEPPVTQWRWRRRDSTPSWGTDNFLGGWGRSVNGTTMVKGQKKNSGRKDQGKWRLSLPQTSFTSSHLFIIKDFR